MAHFVRLAAGKHDTIRLKRLLLQSIPQFTNAHTASLSEQPAEFQHLRRGAEDGAAGVGAAAAESFGGELADGVNGELSFVALGCDVMQSFCDNIDCGSR